MRGHQLGLNALSLALLVNGPALPALGGETVTAIRLRTIAPGPVARAIGDLFRRQVEARCPARLVRDAGDGLTIEIRLDRRLKPEGYRIADGRNGAIRIIGADDRGLLYGVGRFLRGSRYLASGFQPSAWRGASAPEKPFRAIYFATHFHNYYHDAPVAEIERYVEELGLWGYNAVIVWYDMHHFRGFDDPDAVRMRERLRAILRAARRIGLRTGLTLLANEGYADSPQELRLTPPTQIEVRGMYGTELCPSKPGAMDVVLRSMGESFGAYRDIGLDYLSIWPYDQGGCGCAQCRPWGCNGFLKAAKPIAELARRMYPRVKIVLSTWLFDAREDEGEWAGLAKALADDPGWVDYVLADSHTTFPRYPIERGVPGGLPLVNFPEISMWGMSPWGGYGSNPLPVRFQGLWDSAKAKLSGGFPYSEGIYEDLNKAVYAGFYWQADRRAEETIREYAAYEFGPDTVEDVPAAVRILEANHTRPAADAGSLEALRHLNRAARTMTPQALASWRWRILYLRAVLDAEHYSNAGKRTQRAEEALRELVRIYHAERALDWVRPPVGE